MGLSARVKHDVRFFQITMHESLAVQRTDEMPKLARSRAPIALPGAGVSARRNFLHEHIASDGHPTQTRVCSCDDAGCRHSAKFEVICLAKTASSSGTAKQILQQVQRLLEVVTLQHPSFRRRHRGTASLLQASSLLNKRVRIGQHLLDKRVHGRRANIPIPISKSPD